MVRSVDIAGDGPGAAGVKAATDEALVEALRERSVAALEELYDRHHRVALAVAYRVVGDPALAEDVVQEAFTAVWTEASGFKSDRGRARGWLLSIVRHRAIDMTRKVSFQRERMSLDDVVVHPAVPDAWPEVALSLDREMIKKAMASLPDEQREAINMAYFGGLTNQEIAGKLGIPLGTVKGRIRLGMQKLKALLGDDATGGTA